MHVDIHGSSFFHRYIGNMILLVHLVLVKKISDQLTTENRFSALIMERTTNLIIRKRYQYRMMKTTYQW